MMSKNPFARMGGNGGMPFGGGGGGGGGPDVNVDELFQHLFGFTNGGQSGAMPSMFMGGMGGPMGGMGGMGGFPPNVRVFQNGIPVNIGQGMQKPTPIIKTVPVTMEQVLNGANLPVEIERWILENGNKVFERETIYVPIPKGVDDNEIILLRDKGNATNEYTKGDIKLFIKVENTTDFKRHGLDLILEKKISLKEALCGFNFELKYINGKSYTINNNPGSIVTPSYFKAIPNMGLTREGHTGNLVITFEVLFPETLEIDKINLLKDIL